ncbi:tetratricopeptide repeat-containing sulfotransferase family protein [Parerythrobacter lacustris]|uniref:Sulfotransferase n=1 Tax=Parerythrobacter lacustris TaxID=2969984 RepID=A0ABT1XR92_9SPHN|nr:tetratricopeptide repeat-containing sulfotransferase family protein [Parerythrobacter lacustris]MCR2833789.1 sulfotransferase [Parerythrobacter lacustris]
MTQHALERAYAARQEGDDAGAEALCRTMLQGDPKNFAAQSLLAVCLAERGEIADARPLAEQAVADEPDNWRFLLNLSVIREIDGDSGAALDCARSATGLAPERFEAWGRLGDLAGMQGKFEEAILALERASDLKEDHPALALRLAGAAFETGKLDICQKAIDRFERIVPGHPDALRLKTHLLRMRGDRAAYGEAASQWLAAEPNDPAARVALAHALAQREDYDGAVETYRPLVEAHPDDAAHAAALAQYMLWAREFETAERLFLRALELDPKHGDAAAGLARLHIYRGEMDSAERLARQAIGADPGNVEGYAQLALATNSALTDSELQRLRALADDPRLEPGHRVVAGFTAGEVHHRRKEFGEAFDAWIKANELKRASPGDVSGIHYDREQAEQWTDRLRATFREVPDQRTSAITGQPTPLFVVGMPRSGTTLLDVALAAHRDIASGGELPAMPGILERFMEWARAENWLGGPIPEAIAEAMRAAYLSQYARYGIAEAKFVVDKQPLNFQSVGLIRHLFPAAPIIHIRRNPLETGFSIFRKNFTRSWTFSTSLADIGHFYGQYMRVTDHWRDIDGDAWTEVRFETLAAGFESQMRRIVEHIGLEWDPACLDYHKRSAIVTTLSSTQIRKPPSTDHIDSTSPYAVQLQPLRLALERAGVRVS